MLVIISYVYWCGLSCFWFCVFVDLLLVCVWFVCFMFVISCFVDLVRGMFVLNCLIVGCVCELLLIALVLLFTWYADGLFFVGIGFTIVDVI